MANRQIHVTGEDMQRLRHVLGSAAGASARDQEHLATLCAELDRAVIVSDEDVPPDVIRMHTRVRIRDRQSGRSGDYTLVYPWEADVGSSRVSVLAPLGTALLGFREGDQIEWRMPGGVRRLRVEKILRQSDRALGAGGEAEAADMAAAGHALGQFDLAAAEAG